MLNMPPDIRKMTLYQCGLCEKWWAILEKDGGNLISNCPFCKSMNKNIRMPMDGGVMTKQRITPPHYQAELGSEE